MSREDYLFSILQSMAKFQHSIAQILEAKAHETEKAHKWILGQHSAADYESHSDQVKHPLSYHDHLLEVIDGLTKMENALAKNLQALLGAGGESGQSGGSGDESDDDRDSR